VHFELEFELDARARRDDQERYAALDPPQNLDDGRSTQTIPVVGLISSAAWGQGRSSADRQFYYVNGRPCDLKAVSVFAFRPTIWAEKFRCRKP
jgi:DNA mismatch repair ATPase MutL